MLEAFCPVSGRSDWMVGSDVTVGQFAMKGADMVALEGNNLAL